MKLDFVNVSFTENQSKPAKTCKNQYSYQVLCRSSCKYENYGGGGGGGGRGRVVGLSPKTQNIAAWYNINVIGV